MNIVGNKIYIKILFFGTALAGKTTALQWLFKNLIPFEMKITEKVRSIKTSFGQTLLFDFVPIQVSNNIIVRIYTATGQDYYTSTRRMLFEEVDGIFFIIDSQKKELEHNKEFVEEFRKHITSIDNLKKASVVVLFNKQDLEETHDPEYLKNELKLKKYSSWPSCAKSGMNLDTAFTSMLSDLLSKIKDIKTLRK
ncbi:MAG: GTP-binding protein [Candidatus Aminicenantaceae bacterium]